MVSMIEELESEKRSKECRQICEALLMNVRFPTERAALERVVRKIHENLAHCGKADLIRALKHSNAPSAGLDVAKSFKCDTRDRNAGPKISKNSKVTKATSPFAEITMDVKQLPG